MYTLYRVFKPKWIRVEEFQSSAQPCQIAEALFELRRG